MTKISKRLHQNSILIFHDFRISRKKNFKIRELFCYCDVVYKKKMFAIELESLEIFTYVHIKMAAMLELKKQTKKTVLRDSL